MKKVECLNEILTFEPEKVIVPVVNLKMLIREAFSEVCIKNLLRMRPDINSEIKSHLICLVQQEREEIKKRTKKSLGKMLRRGVMTEYMVHAYVIRFRQRRQDKMEFLARAQKQKQSEDLLTINASERLEIEESSISMRGYLGVAQASKPDNEREEDFVEQCGKLSYKKQFFFFLDDVVLWKDKSSAKQINSRIFLCNITKIGIQGDLFIYFIFGQHYYFLKAESLDERKSWVKVLVFLRDESMKELKPLTFEK